METHTLKSAMIGLSGGVAGGGLNAVGVALGLTSSESIWPVAATCVVLGTLLHHTKQSLGTMLDNRTHTLRNRVERIGRDIGDIHGLVRLAPYTSALPLPIGGGWALTGDSAALLAREVLIRAPNTILELGSGVSTLILGQILKQRGHGHLLSIDHDPLWADKTRANIDYLGLQDFVSVLDAPLKTVTLGGQAYNWYDIQEDRLAALGPIDLLLVDGPPQAEHSATQARYPAFPMLRERLSPEALIFVDDANRSTESKMVERWQTEDSGWHAQRFGTVDGVCILTKKNDGLITAA